MTGVGRDVAGVERRIEAIAGRTLPSAPASSRFGALVSSQLGRVIERAALAAHVDPSLVAAVAEAESGFNPGVTSPTGAAGLMQLMPATAQALGVSDPYDPAQNVRGGASYLRELLARFHGDVRLAVAAYNAGPSAVAHFGGVPPYAETEAYVARVMVAYRARRLL
ncbi:MAG: lytic transglycosylase domain-containing protein [Candidatus Eremiobacteraeota bacterium]|nr:lytic transglycosylase domain-containing protein [Candidatus Eremiobacteraeota bacterium]